MSEYGPNQTMPSYHMPECVTAFQNQGQRWDTPIGAVRVKTYYWRVGFWSALACSVLLLLILIYQIQQPLSQVYVAQIQKNGFVERIAELDPTYPYPASVKELMLKIYVKALFEKQPLGWSYFSLQQFLNIFTPHKLSDEITKAMKTAHMDKDVVKLTWGNIKHIKGNDYCASWATEAKNPKDKQPLKAQFEARVSVDLDPPLDKGLFKGIFESAQNQVIIENIHTVKNYKKACLGDKHE